MEDYFTVYTKADCPWCVKALSLLLELEESFMHVDVSHMTEAHRNNIKEFIGWETFPMILHHEADVPPRLIGGCTDLFDFFDEELPNDDV